MSTRSEAECQVRSLPLLGRWRARLACFAVGGVLLACGHPQESISPTVASQELSAEAIDADPLALLPGGAIGLVRLDVAELARSTMGPPLFQLARQLVGGVGIAGLVPERDLSRIVFGIYSMQGTDLVGVGIGKFDAAAFEAAAAGAAAPSAGARLVKSLYAGRTLYTVNNLGVCLLTPKTALFGNETGMRRALDRLKEGRAGRRLPAWMDALLTNEKASLAVGADLRVEAFSDSIRRQLPFVQDLEAARILGNLQPPGLNLAGSLGYASKEAAVAASQSVQSLSTLLAQSSWLMSLLGVSQPIVRLTAQPQNNDVDFVAAFDGAVLTRMLEQALGMVPTGGVSTTTVPAKLTEGVR
jgi:hypothetical protein